MHLLAVSINGLLDTKNFYPLALELKAKHSINVDICSFKKDLVDKIAQYDGLIVGSDWNQNADIVRAFNERGKKTFLVQSEGMFLDEKQWYARKPPITQYACLWGHVHERIFRERGYRGISIVTGPPRLDTYLNFKPSLTREEVYSEIGLDDPKKDYILFIGQFFAEGEWGRPLFDAQVALTEFACKTPDDFYAVVKSHPQEATSAFFSRAELCKRIGGGHVVVVDRGAHTEAVEITTLLYHAGAVVSFSSTASMEAAFLGRPSAIFEGGLESPLANGVMASLPRVSSAEDLRALVSQGPRPEQLEPFASLFLPGPITGRFTRDTAAAIARFAREPASEYARSVRLPPKPESDEDTAGVAAFRQVSIDAHTSLAELITKVGGDSLASLPSYDIREAGYYQSLHDQNNGYQVNNWMVPEAADILRHEPRHVVEIGCGNGRFLHAIAGRVEKVTGLDFARSPKLSTDLPNNVQFIQADVTVGEIPAADLICSADVLEHLSRDDVLRIIERLHEKSLINYHVIACYDDGHSHMTIEPPAWWLYAFKRLSTDYRIKDIRPRRGSSKQLVCVITNSKLN